MTKLISSIKQVAKIDLPDFTKTFRRGVLKDFPEDSLNVKKLFFNDHINEKYFTEKIDKHLGYLVGGYSDGKCVGYMSTNKIYGGIIFVSWLGVLKSYRRKGVGSSLIKWLKKEVKNKGAHAIHLYSVEKNLEFYKKLGFRDVGLVEKGYFGVDQHFMIKILQEPKEENFLKS